MGKQPSRQAHNLEIAGANPAAATLRLILFLREPPIASVCGGVKPIANYRDTSYSASERPPAKPGACRLYGSHTGFFRWANMTTAAVIAAFLLAGIPAEPWPVQAAVDCIEVNTVLDHDGIERFTQVMWCDLGPGMCEVRAWRFLQSDHLPIGHICLFRYEGRTVAIYVADPQPFVSRTWFDPEVRARGIPKPEWQRPIWGPK